MNPISLIPAAVSVLFFLPTAPAAEKPNILFIFMDDMGWTDAGCYGSDFYETKNIDRLAREGMRFTDAYVNGPVCTPSRACVIAGQTGPRHGIYMVSPSPKDKENYRRWKESLKTRPMVPVPNNKILPDSVVGLPAALKGVGYVTGFTGKWHHQPDPSALGFDLHLRTKKIPDDPKRIYALTDAAVSFIREHRDQPFFFYLSHHAPHVGVEARPERIAKYRRKTPGRNHSHPEYAAMLDHADESIGTLLDVLAELDLSKKTVVVFFSDNGGFERFTTMKPLRGGKGQMYEGGIRVPLIVRWPGVVKSGSVCSKPVTGVDLYPTFLEIAGASRPAKHPLDGESLVPLLKGGTVDRETLFWHYPVYTMGYGQAPCGVVRSGDFKLIEFFEDDRVELYDLGNDMGESNNLAGSMPVKASELRNQLAAWRESVKAPMPEHRK